MGKKRLSRSDKVFYDSLRKDADLYASTHIKPTGEVKFIQDGKEEFLVSFRWPSLISLLVGFHVNEVMKRVENETPKTS